MDIRLSQPESSASSNIRYRINKGQNFSQEIAGPKTPEGMCLFYLRSMLQDFPQYVNKLYAWFRDRPEQFQWYDPGECMLLPKGQMHKTGIFMRLEIQKERNPRTRKFRYEEVEVEFTFDEIEAMKEPDISKIPRTVQ